MERNDISKNPHIVQAREEHFKKSSIEEPFTLAVGGDIIQTNPISQLKNPVVRGILDVIRDSDVSFANMESNFGDRRNQPTHIGGLQGTKAVAQDVKDMGFDLVARASNHSTGMGTEEMLLNNRYLQDAGIVYAGSGINLEDARAPQYLETPKGRVGLVAMTMSPTGRVAYLVSNSGQAGLEMASYGAGNMNGLPGVNMLRVRQQFIVSKEQFESLKKIRDDQNEFAKECMEKAGARNTGGRGEASAAAMKNIYGDESKSDRVLLNGQYYRMGDRRCGISYEMNEDDLRLNLRSIRDGKEWSDFMIATIHSHDYDNTAPQLDFMQEAPSDFIVELAHKSIDNGADMFVGTGPHLLRGIEIYKGRPVFYSLASFVYQLWGTPIGPDRYTDNHLDSFYGEATGTEINMEMWPPLSLTKHPDLRNMESMESALAECKYENGLLKEVRMHPIEFGYDAPISQRGIPRVPSPEVAVRILHRLQRMSEPFGTKISIENNLGIIRI